jgi:hypothetical protein
MPPYGTPPIQPSPPPPVYCTECGREVYPPAWLCATCGKPLHEPGAMTSTRINAPATQKNSKPDRIIGEGIFAVLIVVLFFVLDFGLRMHWIPEESPGHPFGSPSVVYLVVFVLFLWVVITDRS